jgi:hypothetical protein
MNQAITSAAATSTRRRHTRAAGHDRAPRALWLASLARDSAKTPLEIRRTQNRSSKLYNRRGKNAQHMPDRKINKAIGSLHLRRRPPRFTDRRKRATISSPRPHPAGGILQWMSA